MMGTTRKQTWGVVGCGWLGTELAKSLMKEGHKVHGTTRDNAKAERLEKIGIQSHKVDISELNGNLDWLRDLDILVINVPPSSVENYAQSLGSICKRLNDRCKIIFVSSTSVYPDINDWVNEATPATGENRNGPKVASAEQLLNSMVQDRLTILRMSGLVGGDRNPVKYMTGKSISGGDAPVNLVHREDCIGIIKKVIDENYHGKVLNVCCSEHPSKKSYYTYAAEKLNIPAPEFKSDQSSFKRVDNSRSVQDLKYTYKYDSPFDFPF